MVLIKLPDKSPREPLNKSQPWLQTKYWTESWFVFIYQYECYYSKRCQI